MQNFENAAHQAFCEYAEAKARVEQTMDFADAMAAGRAWRVFLNAFLAPDQKLPTGEIIPFPRRAQ